MSADKERVRELVARCLAELDEHGTTVVDDVCRESPELADAVRRRISTLERAGLVGPGASSDEPFPDRLGEFKLLRRIGGGGMGVVYLAEQTSLGRKVALKLVRPELLYFPGARERFRREVDAVAKLRHPNVVPIYTYSNPGSAPGSAPGSEIPYYAMEWVDGASFDEVLHLLRGKRPETLGGADLRAALGACCEARAADQLSTDAQPLEPPPDSLFSATSWIDVCFRLIAPLALALAHAHQQGVIHRDLKPSNLMLTRDGRVLLVDFGLASTRGTSRLTKTGAQLGSLPYTPPEQLEQGSDAVDERSDVYSLGVVLYELLTLAPAFGGEGATPEATRRAVLSGAVRPIRERNPAVRWDVETVCLVAMEREPARRYASAAAFAADLGNVLHRHPIAARRPGVLLRARRLAQRHPALTVAALLGALLLIAVPGVWAWQEHKARNAAQAALARVQRSSRRARGAIREFLTKVAAIQLENVPGAEKLRKELLEQAVRACEEIFAEEPTPEVRVELAFALGQLALREENLGLIAEARGHFERALALLEGEGAPPLATPAAQLTRATVVGEFANFEAANGTRTTSLAWRRRAAQLWEAVAREQPSPQTTLEHLNSLLALADSPDVPLAEATALTERIVPLAEALAPKLPGDPRPRVRAAQALMSLGSRCQTLGEPLRALPLLRDGTRRLAALDQEFPGRVELRTILAHAALALGQLLRTRDLLDEARGVLADGVDVATLLVEGFPARPDFHSLLGYLSLARAECLHDLGEDAAARAAHARARDEFDAALALAPEDRVARDLRGGNERAFAALLCASGDFASARVAIRRALDFAQAAVAVAPDPAWNHLELAEVWLVLARNPQLHESGEGTIALAEESFAAASAALACDPECADFAGCAREAVAVALGELLARATTGAGEAAAARDQARALLRRLLDVGAASSGTLADSLEFAPLRGSAAFADLLSELTTR